jgi:hypothetical protein
MSNNVPLSLNRLVVLILMNARREGSVRINARALIDTISPPGDDNSKSNYTNINKFTPRRIHSDWLEKCSFTKSAETNPRRLKLKRACRLTYRTRDFSHERLLPALIKTYQFQANHRYLMIFFPPLLRGSADLDVRFLSEKVPQERQFNAE